MAKEMAAAMADSAKEAVMAQVAAAEAKEAAAAMAVVMVEARGRREGVEGLRLLSNCFERLCAYFRTCELLPFLADNDEIASLVFFTLSRTQLRTGFNLVVDAVKKQLDLTAPTTKLNPVRN